MKSFQMQGFPDYRVNEDGTVINTKTGKKVAPVKKTGKVSLICTEPVEGFEVGTTYPMLPADLIKVGNEGDAWEVIQEATPSAASEMPVELTDEQKAEKARKEKVAELKKAIAVATTNVVNASIGDDTNATIAAGEVLKAAKKELADFEEANKPQMSEEQKLAEAAYEDAKESYNGFKEVLEVFKADYLTAKAALQVFRKVSDKVSGGGNSGTGESRAPHLSYEIAQNIRKDFSVGRFGNAGEAVSKKALAEKYGCSQSAVHYIVNYLQHKLKTGDTAYTPLVNDFYNATSEFPNGAPMAEEKIKETAERYLLPANRKNGISATVKTA